MTTNDKSTEVALLLTFLDDQEMKSLAKSEDFQNHIVKQKKIIADILKNGFALKSTVVPSTGEIQKTLVPAPTAVYKPQSKPATPAAPVIVAPAVTAPASNASVLSEVTQLFAEKTGYPVDMLEPMLDLEADLGIDTVKQMEILGLVRKKYSLKLQEGFTLKQTPNIQSIAQLVAAG